MSIVLSDHISDITLDVRTAGLLTGPGGVALFFELNDGPLAFRLTNNEARWLLTQIQRRLTEADPGDKS